MGGGVFEPRGESPLVHECGHGSKGVAAKWPVHHLGWDRSSNVTTEKKKKNFAPGPAIRSADAGRGSWYSD